MPKDTKGSSQDILYTDQLAFSMKRLSCVADIGTTTLYADAKNGKLRAKRVGNKLIVPRARAIEYINNLPDALED